MKIEMPNGQEREVTAEQLDGMVSRIEANVKRIEERLLKVKARLVHFKEIRNAGIN